MPLLADAADGGPMVPAEMPLPVGGLPASLNVSAPNPARIYDYLLGGAYNFAADRQAIEQAMAAGHLRGLPVRASRAFLRRAVRYLVERGVDQFIELGSGIPTAGHVHEVARRVNPDTRVVYVDNSPVTVAHSRHLVGDDPRIVVVEADIRRPKDVLEHPDTTGLLDLTRPVGVLLVSVLAGIPDEDDPGDMIAQYSAAVADGSFLALAHYSDEARTPAQREDDRRSRAAFRERTGTTVITRGRAALATLLADLTLVEPGIVWAPEWHPDPLDPDLGHPSGPETYAALARITDH